MKEIAMRHIREALEASGFNPIVHGEGNLDAKLVLVGEAPGSREVELGMPFVGQAGKNLDTFLSVVGVQRKSVYITNVVKTRPFRINPKTGRKNNRPPSKDEVRFFVRYLQEEIDLVNPDWVITLGNTALRAVTGDQGLAISDVHGHPLEKGKRAFDVFPLYHPAAVIYNRDLERVYLEDLENLRNQIRQTEEGRSSSAEEHFKAPDKKGRKP